MARGWWRRLAIAAMVVATWGCSGADAPRIVPWQLETPGAPPVVVGAFDAKERVHCRFLPATDGQLRCLPASQEPLRETVAFADPSCQRRVYRTTSTRAMVLGRRPTAVPLPRASCEPQLYVVGVLEALPAGTTLFGGAPCVPLDASAGPGPSDVDLVVAKVVEPERWATGTEVDGPLVGKHVRLRQIETADGTRFDHHLVDPLWGPCTLTGVDLSGGSAFGSLSLSCNPPTLPELAAWTEGTDCMGMTVWRAPACLAPAYIDGNPLDASPARSIGPKWTGPVSRYGNGASCEVVPSGQGGPDGPDVYYEGGRLISAPGGSPPIEHVDWTSIGTGRLRVRGVAGPAGEFVAVGNEIALPRDWFATRYFDNVTQRDCDPQWTPEGLVRCMSSAVLDLQALSVGPFPVVAFSDDKCTKPAYSCGQSPCGVRWRSVISMDVDAHGEKRATAVNEVNDLQEAYVSNNGGCMPQNDPSLPRSFFFTLGDPLPWERFPALREVNGRPSGAP